MTPILDLSPYRLYGIHTPARRLERAPLMLGIRERSPPPAPPPLSASTGGPSPRVPAETDEPGPKKPQQPEPKTQPPPEPEPEPEPELESEAQPEPGHLELPDLSLWLQACGCAQLEEALHELGAEHPTDLLHLNEPEMEEVLAVLKKLPRRKFHRQLAMLQAGEFAESHLELLPPASPKKKKKGNFFRAKIKFSTRKPRGESGPDAHGFGNHEKAFDESGSCNLAHMTTAMRMMGTKVSQLHQTKRSTVHFTVDERPVYLMMADHTYCPPGQRSDGRPRRVPSDQPDPGGHHDHDLSFYKGDIIQVSVLTNMRAYLHLVESVSSIRLEYG